MGTGNDDAPPPDDADMAQGVSLEELERAQNEKPVEPLRILKPLELDGLPIPSRRWLVEHWIPKRVVTGLYGDGGIGKSLLLLQLQTALSRSDLPWIGLQVEPTTTLGIYCEDDDSELHRRQANINEAYGIGMRDVPWVEWVPRLGQDNLMMTFTSRGVGELTPFYHQVKEHALDIHAGAVIVDTAADTFGGNEMDRGQVRQYVQRALGGLALAIDGAALVAAHPSQSGITSGTGTSGSTGWNNAFRSRMYLSLPQRGKDKNGSLDQDEEPPDPNARVLTRLKANYAAMRDTIELHWRSGALIPDAGLGGKFRRPVEEVYMALLDICRKEGKQCSPGNRAATYAPTLFSQRPKAQRDDYRRPDFERAQAQLFRERRVKIFTVGKGSREKNIVDRADLTEEQLNSRDWMNL